MLRTLRFLIPVLIPSWRFFDVIAPSPRIEVALLKTVRGKAVDWQAFRPRPVRLSMFDMFKRMVWNPHWNETLFLASLAERLVDDFSEHDAGEILARIRRELAQGGVDPAVAPYLQFRLVFVDREEGRIRKRVMFVSPVHSYMAEDGGR